MAIQDFISNRHLEREGRNSPTPAGILDRAPAIIKVIGVGSGGCNSVKRMRHHSVPGTSFAMVNTDNIVLEDHATGVDVIQIGANKARAWGAGVDYTTDGESADESTQQLRQSISNADLVFITAGMGGGAGTSAAPYVAHLARAQGALVVGLVTAPFSFEGHRRMGLAVAGVDQLRPYVDNLILIHNDRLLSYIDHRSHMAQAFQKVNEVVTQAIIDVSEVINAPQAVNLEIAGVRYLLDLPGSALLAVGRGSGTAGPAEAVRQAISSPLLDLSFNDATGVMAMLKGGAAGITLGGVNAARQVLKGTVRNHSHVFIGVDVDERMGEEVSLTLIATGLQQPERGRSG